MNFGLAPQPAQKQPAATQPARTPAPVLGNQARLRGLQTKLQLGATDDPLEHEADALANRVMRMPGSTSGETPIQPSLSAASDGAPAPASVNATLQSPGQPLDAGTRNYFEPRFGADFSAVRVHHNAEAARSAQDIGARAYTAGQDLVFAPGAYAPASDSGRQLIAHELTHVLQQNAGGTKIQRDTDPDPAAAQPGVLDLAAAEDLSAKNPKLIAFAADFQRMLAKSPKSLLFVNTFWDSKPSFDKGGSPREVLMAPAVTRAATAKAALIALGIPADRISETPSDLNESAKGTDGATQLVAVDTLALVTTPPAIMPTPPLAPVQPGEPQQSAPQAAKPAAGSPLDFSKFTTIQIQTPNLSFAMKIPSSIELKSKFVEGKISFTPGLGLKFRPIPSMPGVEIGLSGEVTSLSSLTGSSTPAAGAPGAGAPKATPPLKFGLSVGYNGKGFKIEVGTEVNLDNTSSVLDNNPSALDGTPSADHRGKVTTGLYVTLTEPQVKYQIPSSVWNDLNSNGAKLQQAINSLMGTQNPPDANQPVGGPPAAPPAAQSGPAAVIAVATAIAGIADAMDKIDKAKKQKATPTLKIGIGVVDPIGPPGAGGTTSNKPIPTIGISGTFSGP